MQAALEGIAEHIANPQQASVQAALAAIAKQLQVRASSEADSDEER